MTEDNINEHALLATENIIKLAQEYTKQMSMPPEATSSVLRALQAAQALRSMVDSQYKSNDDTKRRLIVHAPKESIGDALLKSIDNYCLTNIFPYSFVAIIDQKIYPMALGLNLKLLADPRIFRGWQIVTKETIITEGKEGKEGNYICRVTKRANFANGEFYESTGICDYRQLIAANTKNPGPALVEMKAETRAERRAALKALALMGMIIEDSTDVEGDKSEDAQSAF